MNALRIPSFAGAVLLLLATGCDEGDSQSSTPESAPLGDPPQLYAGFRSSRYGIRPFPEPEWWGNVGTTYAAEFDGARPGGVWIVGTVQADGTCRLNFPDPGVSGPSIAYGDTDENEDYLTHFDALGLDVWLQVEPGMADMETLIDVVLDQYGSHSSVVGFGVDVEWFGVTSETPGGTAVSDEQAAAWRSAVQAHDADYTVFLKHWEIPMMPPTERDGLFFINDSQGVNHAPALVAEFATWGGAFRPSPVGFQIGYSPDEGWWSTYDNPPAELGQQVVDAIGNTGGLFWVDFTLYDVFGN